MDSGYSFEAFTFGVIPSTSKTTDETSPAELDTTRSSQANVEVDSELGIR